MSKADSAGNGLAEGAVKEVKAKTRTMRFALEENLGCKVDDDHPALACLVEWAAASVNIARIGADGKTPYELRFGRRWRREVAQFGEKAMWMSPGKHSGGGATQWQQDGCFLGLILGGAGSCNWRIGTPDGLKEARCFKRLSPSLQ